MAIKFSDIALAQVQGANFPGAPGQAQIVQPPTQQNNPLFEGPPELIATYVLDGTEAVGDIILLGIAPAGVVIGVSGRVNSGLTAPATTLTVAIGDNDQGNLADLPLPSFAGAQPTQGQVNAIGAPAWVSGTTYAPGNVVIDTAATSGIFQQNDAYTCISATSGTTAPHSAATTVWMPIYQRYSGTISVAAASGNVTFAGGTQAYGGPASIQPFSVTPGAVPTGLTAKQIANMQYQIQNDCWIMARVLTSGTPVANTVLVFRLPMYASN